MGEGADTKDELAPATEAEDRQGVMNVITANTGRSVGAVASSTAQTKRSARVSVYARAAEKERESRTSQGSGALLETFSAAQSGRRAALSAGFGISVAALFPSTALALLPDDDDEELIKRAKAKRSTKLREELATERNFVGLQKGNLDAAATVIGNSSTAWATNLTSLAKRKSAGKASEPAGMMLSSLDVLQKSVMNGDDKKAKNSYAATAEAMENFISAVGMTDSIKGLK